MNYRENVSLSLSLSLHRIHKTNTHTHTQRDILRGAYRYTHKHTYTEEEAYTCIKTYLYKLRHIDNTCQLLRSPLYLWIVYLLLARVLPQMLHTYTLSDPTGSPVVNASHTHRHTANHTDGQTDRSPPTTPHNTSCRHCLRL